jgi:hypothetical protein
VKRLLVNSCLAASVALGIAAFQFGPFSGSQDVAFARVIHIAQGVHGNADGNANPSPNANAIEHACPHAAHLNPHGDVVPPFC